MSDTPETDLAEFVVTYVFAGREQSLEVVTSDKARRLERERDEARRELAEILETYRNIINEPCRNDEKHCTCVPALREENRKLREALNECREDSIELLGERDWWKNEPRGNHLEQYKQTEENIRRADELLKEKP